MIQSFFSINLAKLKVNIIWLSPIYPHGGKDGGYDVTDFYNIKPFPNYKNEDNKFTILNKGDKNAINRKENADTELIKVSLFTSRLNISTELV